MTGVEIGVYFMAAAAAATVASAYVQSQALSQQADAAKQAAEVNAENARNQAQSSIDAAGVNEQSANYKAKLLLGAQKAGQGASGVDPLDGSPLALRDQTTQQSTLDGLKIRYGGATQSTAYINQANIDLMEGDARSRALKTQSTGALIGGFAGAASIYASGARYGGGGTPAEGAV